MIENKKTVEQCWQDYLFLTQEMDKFLEKKEYDLFLELMNQREKLQGLIEELPSNSFYSSDKGQEYFRLINQTEQKIKLQLEFLRNTTKRNHQISNAYESFSSPYVGRRMDRQS